MTLTQQQMEESSVQLCEPYMSPQQQEDCNCLIVAADDMAAAASSFGTGGVMGYNAFIQAREHFHEVLASTSKRYRLIAGQ